MLRVNHSRSTTIIALKTVFHRLRLLPQEWESNNVLDGR